MKQKAEARVLFLIAAIIIAVGVIVANAVSINDMRVQGEFLSDLIASARDQGLLANVMPLYQSDAANATQTYIRYESGSGVVFIKRITVVGNVTTFDKSTNAAWSARATATYVAIDAE